MDCIDLFKRAAVALQTDPRYLALDQARKMNDRDEELQNLIGEFNLARMDLNNEIGKTERSDERIAELNQKVNTLYGQICTPALSTLDNKLGEVSLAAANVLLDVLQDRPVSHRMMLLTEIIQREST